jgi:hypothetical protein
MLTEQSYVLPTQEQTPVEPLVQQPTLSPRFDEGIISSAIHAFVDVADTEMSFLVNQMYQAWATAFAKDLAAGGKRKRSIQELDRMYHNCFAVCELLDQIESAKKLSIDKADPECRYSALITDTDGKLKHTYVAATSQQEATQQVRRENSVGKVGWSCLAGRWLRDSFGIIPIVLFFKLQGADIAQRRVSPSAVVI